MDRHKSALKAERQTKKRHKARHSVLASCRTAIRSFNASLAETKPDTAALTKQFDALQKKLMKAGSKRILHPKTASRHVSRLSTKLNKVVSA